MKDMLAHFKDYCKQAAECERIAKLATYDAKRELFARLAERYRVLADEVERAARTRPATIRSVSRGPSPVRGATVIIDDIIDFGTYYVQDS